MSTSSRLRSGLAATAAAATLVGGIVFVAAPGAGAGTDRGAVEQQEVWLMETTTALQASPTTAVEGTKVLFSAAVEVEPLLTGEVTASAPAPTPSGIVTFSEAGSTLGTAELQSTGTATLSTSTLAVGEHDVVATYGGDEYHQSSHSSAVRVTITAVPGPTTTAPPTTVPAAGPAGTYTTKNGAPSSSLTVNRGGTIPVKGSGWQPGGKVEIWLHSDPVLLGTVTAAQDGTFSTSYAAPANAALGAHQIVMTGTAANGQPATVTLALSIVAASTPDRSAAPSTLAFTD